MQLFFQRTAYTFESDLTIREMLPALDQLGLWGFVERDSDRWGVYTSSCAARPGTGAVKILEGDGEDAGRYLVIISYESTDSNASEDFTKMRGELFDKFLPAIGARRIQPHSDYE